MTKTMLGIDIGTSSVRIADVKGSQIMKYLEVPLPDNAVKGGRVVAFNALADVIRTARKENRIHTRRAALSLSAANNIVIRRITMPKMTEAQLMINMPYELHDFLNSDIKDYFFDYSLVSMGEKDMTLIACAIGRRTVENFRAMAKLAGIQIEKIVPDVIALEAVLPAPDASAEVPGDFVILDVGHGGTRMYFYSRHAFEITRNIDAGAGQIADIIAKNRGMDKHAAWTRLSAADPDVLGDPEVDDEIGSFVAQVMRSINFYGYNNPGNTIDRIYYMGSGLPPKCYLHRLEAATNMKCEPVADLLPDGIFAEGINDGPQVYGCIVE
ncbi:type II secretion system protein GspL [Clostridium vitabionis]|uniref:type II secretion system protein GspL n=1 Tax=Clostridium vitabionis TaxID=2784388 RepID=UPI00188AF0AF|nr:pilus assembly protein PilM [Clostridium vitabionis]